MTDEALTLLKYPIGTFTAPETITKQHREDWINTLEYFPEKLEGLVSNLTEQQLNTVYRPGGWTIRQVIHHLPDSHQHSYTRFKWALTEDKPVIKAYYEDRWAELFDGKNAPIALSLLHLEAIHKKLVYLLKGMSETDFKKCFIHPETNQAVFLDVNLGSYAWHSNHHFAHIKNALKNNDWI